MENNLGDLLPAPISTRPPDPTQRLRVLRIVHTEAGAVVLAESGCTLGDLPEADWLFYEDVCWLDFNLLPRALFCIALECLTLL